MKSSMRFLAAGLLLAASVAVHAQTPDFGLRMDSGFYITAGAGKSRTNLDCFGPCDQTDTSWVISAGYQFNRNFAAEIGYVDLGKSTTTAQFQCGCTLVTAITEAKAVELVGVGILPFTDKWAVYVKAGLYRSEAESTSPGLGAGIGSGKANDTGFTFGGGVRYSVTPQFSVHFEWQNYNDVGTGVIGFPPADYTVWRGGARYKF